MTPDASGPDRGLADRLANLSDDKRALLERALIAQRRLTIDDERIPRRAIADPSPLSFSQQRLWFFDRMKPGDPTYNACVGMRLRGSIDLEQLRLAFDAIVRRQEVLRTVFPDVDGVPEQVILDTWRLAFDVLDLRGLEPAEREERLLNVQREAPREPYNLQTDLALRLLLVTLHDDDHILLLMEHHIAFDGWSDEILCEEVSETYRCAMSGGNAELTELPIQYRDFAAWQHRRLQGEYLERLQAFWQRYLDGAPTLAALPTDFPRPTFQTFSGARVYVDLPPDLLDLVNVRCRKDRATPFMVLLAAFQGLLARWAGISDMTVGTPIASRSRVELERLIGFFSNTLVVRGRPNLDDTFRALVEGTREASLAAFEHQELPFDKIVEAVQPPRDTSHNPLFQINFRVTAGGDAVLDLVGVNAEPYSVDIGFSRFDLALELQQLERGLGGYLEYNTALFSERTARSLVDAFGVFLRDALEHPDTLLRDVLMAAPSNGPSIRRARRT